MKRAVLSVLFLLPTLAMAAPFDGTWVWNPASVAWVHAVPETYVLQGGQFTCGVGACSPTFTVSADGRPHSVEGHPSYDNVVVKVVSARTVTVNARKGDTKDWDSTFTVTEDGRTMTVDSSIYEGGKSGTSKMTYNRTAAGQTGSHAISGSWLVDLKSLALSGALAAVSYRETAGGLQMSDPLGDNYDAKFDGKEYLTKGDPTHTLVSIQRLGPRTIRETDHMAGKLSGVYKIEVAEDGKIMQVLAEDKLTGASWKYLLNKTP